jgi:choline dehydrogenase-like flavoprotein
MLQLVRSTEPFDAIVVGSGATGGWAAKKLTEAGMRIGLLEAGTKTTDVDFTDYHIGRTGSWSPPSSGIRAARPIQSSCYACREPRHRWFVNDLENPYCEVKPYRWIRMRVLGGRLLGWERQCYRMSNLDFKASSHDGYGDDWPISYEDIVPYYEEVERYLGVTGISERLPQLPDSVFVSGTNENLTAKFLRDSIRTKFGRVVTPARLAVMTSNYESDQACYYYDPSKWGRPTISHFVTPWSALTDAAKTGRLALMTDAVASHIVIKDGKAIGVGYVDRETHAWREVRGKLVLLCASTLESTRILLNSKICNSSGMLGRYLMDHIHGGGASGVMEGVTGPTVDSHQRGRVYIPRFRNVRGKFTNEFVRGYAFQGKSLPNLSEQRMQEDTNRLPRANRWTVVLSSFGECLARQTNLVEIASDGLDAWGIPTLKIQAEWSENELKIWRDACVQGVEMLRAAGAKEIKVAERPSIPGLSVHETGTARMGFNSKTSVVNQYCQTHDVSNIFVTDGACWVSSGCQNPTLTMMAITVRACDYIVREYLKQTT